MCYVYFISKSWIYNNIICILFCIHALQNLFIGNFKTGYILLTLLFFYDIFFVFGTDVMLTVAKNIDGPIKLMFPKDLTAVPPQFSILGLGDIVIPGVFVSMALRYDFFRSLSQKKLNDLVAAEKKGDGETNGFMKYLLSVKDSCSKHYFTSVMFGYLVAIVTTVVIMIIFKHGQPALLYLVPGCLISNSLCGLAKGDFSAMWDFNEEIYLNSEETRNKAKVEEGKKD